MHTTLDLQNNEQQSNQDAVTVLLFFYSIMLGEEKYGPGSEPQWKADGARYPNLYKALLEESPREPKEQSY